jgi:hypothetical protein
MELSDWKCLAEDGPQRARQGITCEISLTDTLDPYSRDPRP